MLAYQSNPYHDISQSASTDYSFGMRDPNELSFHQQHHPHGAGGTMQSNSHTFHHNSFLDSHQMTQSPLSSYSSTPLHLEPQLAIKRAHSEDHDEDRLSERHHSTSSFSAQTPSQSLQQHHHHHHLPPQAIMHPQSSGDDGSSAILSTGLSSVVGQEGMPEPAPRPRVAKLKFTPEEDSLLVELKEQKNLTWKQIADFFPGRTSGTLQVRYCTKLKVKETTWTEEMVQRLHHAMAEYENDRWRIIASKVGHGFTPAACREKAMELNPEAWQDENEVSE